MSNTVAGAVLVSTAAAAGHGRGGRGGDRALLHGGDDPQRRLDVEIDRARAARAPAAVGPVVGAGAALRRGGRPVRGRRAAAGAGGLASRPSPASALIALIVLYDAWHKGNALSPAADGRVPRDGLRVAGLAVADALNAELWGAAALLLVYVVGLTQVAKAEGGGLAARWPVAGRARAGRVLGQGAAGRSRVALLLAAFLLWAGYALWLVLARRRIGAGVVRLIAGIAIYDALAVAGAGGGAVALAVCLGRLRCHDRSPDQDRGDLTARRRPSSCAPSR